MSDDPLVKVTLRLPPILHAQLRQKAGRRGLNTMILDHLTKELEMPYQPDDPRIVYLPLSDAERAEGSCEVVRNSWWTVHPERGLVFWTRTPKNGLRGAKPQCNRDERVANMVVPQMFPWAEIKWVPLVVWPAE